MKVHLIRKLAIEKYAEKNIESRKGFQTWLSITKYADWQHPVDMLQTFGSAALLGNGSNRVAFNIGVKDHKLICKYVSSKSSLMLFVYWIGTNAEYKQLCENREQYAVCDFESDLQDPISFKIIKTAKQYDSFCGKLESLLLLKKKSRDQFDEIAMLTVLIENHDYAFEIAENADPIELLKGLVEYNINWPAAATKILGPNNNMLPDLLNYRRGVSKEVARRLAERFKLRQEAFERCYNIFSGPSGKVKKSISK